MSPKERKSHFYLDFAYFLRLISLKADYTSPYNKCQVGGFSMDSRNIGKTIRAFREAKGLSQEVLSGLAGMDRSHLSKIELGLRSPTVHVLYKIADAIGVPGSAILASAEREPDPPDGDSLKD